MAVVHTKILACERFLVKGLELLPASQLKIVVTADKRRCRIAGKYRLQPLEITGVEKAEIPRFELLDQFNCF